MKICIDAGHYGMAYNKGAAPGYYESERMWQLGKHLKEELERLGVSVIMTRNTITDNPTLTSRGRTGKNCTLLISLHSNAASDPTANHAVAFYQVPHSGTVDDRSKKAAIRLSEAVGKIMGIPYKTAYKKSSNDKDCNGTLDDNYYTVLHSAFLAGVPAVLVEHGFHTDPKSAEWLMKDSNLKLLAQAEANAIVRACTHNAVSSSDCASSDADIAVAKKYENVSRTFKVTAKSGLRLRTAPETGKKILTMPLGASVKYYGYYTFVNDDVKWMLVVYNGQTGYASAAYLQPV